jgi:hypothetical protein
MENMKGLIALANRGFSKLLRTYPMSVSVEVSKARLAAPGVFILASAACSIEIVFEFGYPIITINDVASAQEFDARIVVAMNAPQYEMEHLYFLQHPDNEKEVVRELRAISEMLVTYCHELLEGTFGPSRIQKYDEFCDLIDSSYDMLKSLPDSDPIKQKERNRDYTWIDDLRQRMRK